MNIVEYLTRNSKELKLTTNTDKIFVYFKNNANIFDSRASFVSTPVFTLFIEASKCTSRFKSSTKNVPIYKEYRGRAIKADLYDQIVRAIGLCKKRSWEYIMIHYAPNDNRVLVVPATLDSKNDWVDFYNKNREYSQSIQASDDIVWDVFKRYAEENNELFIKK